MFDFVEASNIMKIVENVRSMTQDSLLRTFLDKCTGDLSKLIDSEAPDLNDEEKSLIENGDISDKINAIKLYRGRTGIGLINAKLIIDEYKERFND